MQKGCRHFKWKKLLNSSFFIVFYRSYLIKDVLILFSDDLQCSRFELVSQELPFKVRQLIVLVCDLLNDAVSERDCEIPPKVWKLKILLSVSLTMGHSNHVPGELGTDQFRQVLWDCLVMQIYVKEAVIIVLFSLVFLDKSVQYTVVNCRCFLQRLLRTKRTNYPNSDSSDRICLQNIEGLTAGK